MSGKSTGGLGIQLTEAGHSKKLPLPPRRVCVAPGASRFGLWVFRIFILPHTLVGIGAFGFLIFLLMWRWFGIDLPGVVTGTETSRSRKGSVSYIVKYEYLVGAERKSGSDGVSQELYERFRHEENERPKVSVHYFALGSHEHARLAEEGSHWGEIGMVAAWATFWNLAIGVALYQIWVMPLRLRWLYKYGEETPGTLVAKREKPGKTITYYITYIFTVNETGEVRTVESKVENVPVWKLIPIGQPVIVLYARDNPKRSTVYELGGYAVEAEKTISQGSC